MIAKSNISAALYGWGIFIAVFVTAGIAWFSFDSGFREADTSTLAAENMPQDEFESRMRDYIMNNPEVLIEAVQGFQERQRAAELDTVQTVVRARSDEILNDPGSPVGGNPDGDVTLVEFFDYNCPYCRRVVPVMADVERGDTQLRIVYKEFPILGAHSTFAAMAALAAREQGKYIEFHTALMRVNGTVNETAVMNVAQELGMDPERLREDMNRTEIKETIERNLQLARALRITGTPSFVVGEAVVRGATDVATLQTAIAEARASGSHE